MRNSKIRKNRNTERPNRHVEEDIFQGDVLLNVGEVCRLLRVPAATIYQLTHRGRIPHFKIANRLRFRRSEILDWIEERRVRRRESEGERMKRHKIKNSLTHSE
jgi:excisionase family DNA binding protein